MKRAFLLAPFVGGLVCGLLLLCTLLGEAQAATYYVATTGVNSRNCNTAQTITTPKQTISNAVLCLTPGDTLYVRAGTYAETLYCPSSGSGPGFVCIPSGTSYAAAVTVSAYPSEVVTIRPNSGLRLMNFDQGQHHIIINGFVLDGVNVDYQTIQLDHTPHHIRIQNNEIKNSHGNGVNIGPDTDSIEVLNNHIHDIQAGPISPFVTNGVYVQSNNNLVSGNSIHHCAGYGIHIYNGFSGDSANNNVITKNITYSNGTYTPSNVAGILIGSGSGNIASNNISYGNPIGIRVGYGPTVNNQVFGNTVYGNTASQGQIGIYVADGSGAIVRNNIMHLNGTNYVNSGTSTTQSNNLGVSSSPDPLFVNAGSANFHIQSGSPARDTGITLGAPYNVDFDGNARPQGSAYDIGAYEFVTTSAPAAPTSPTATPGNTQVTVGWTASAGATSYTVLRSTTSGGGYSVAQSGISASPYINTSLTNGTTYYFVIQAVNASGSSPNSTQASATPQPPAPSAPTGLGATQGDTQVSLAWTATAGATSYNVLRSLTSGSGYAQIISGLTSPSYLNTSLTNGTTYYYVVQAVNGGGTSPNSGQVGATPTSPPPPIAAPPTNFIAIASSTQVSLSWTASTGATTYTVKRGTVGGGPYGVTVISGLATTSHVDTSLTNGTTYYYVVTAVNGSGESGNSTEASATPQIPAPAAPTSLTPTAGDAQVSLSWTAAAGATSYNVYQSTITGGPYGAAVATGITGTSYNVTALTNATLYFFVVTAVNAGGESAFATETSATPQPAVPAAPTGLDVTASSQHIALSWLAVEGADIYTVSRAIVSGGAFTLIATGITNLTYSDFDAANGTPYYYVVTATNINGTSLSSAEISATARVAAATHVIGLTRTIGRVLTH